MSDNPIDNKALVRYDPNLALAICDLVAEGEALVDIAKRDDMPSRKTIYRWMTLYPKFFEAYERAREISAQSFEDKALQIAAKLEMANDFTGTKVTALNYAMQQYRWSAAHRDPKRYAQTNNQTTTVPIQINTTLNLAQDGMPPAADTSGQSIYSISVEIPSQPAVVEGNDDQTVDDLGPEGEVLDLTATEGENGRAFGVPETDRQDLHRPKVGRPRKRHKSPSVARQTAALYAKRQAKHEGTKE